MKKVWPLTTFICLMLVGVAQAMPIDYKEGAWSKPVNGLRGRLLIEQRPTINDSMIIGVVLELENVSDRPLLVLNDPALADVELFDGAGKPIASRRDLPLDGLVAYPEWKTIPPHQSIQFAIESHSVGVPHGVIFIDLYAHNYVDRVWTPDPAVHGSEYFLHGTFRHAKDVKDDLPTHWNGTLELPFVKITAK